MAGVYRADMTCEEPGNGVRSVDGRKMGLRQEKMRKVRESRAKTRAENQRMNGTDVAKLS